MDKSVVTASGYQQNVVTAPASISIVNPNEIATRPARDLGEMIANVPGVSIDMGATKTGGYDISIRGMGSGYTLVLVDGKRTNGDDSIFPNGYGGSLNSFLPPLSAIERIEVIRGPASTLYGSDAMGGVINIITKKNFSKWGSNISLDYTAQENKRFGNTRKLSFYTAGPLNEAKNWGLSLRGSQYSRDAISLENASIGYIIGNSVTTGSALTGFGSGPAGTIVGAGKSEIYNVGARLQWHSLDSIGGEAINSIYADVDYGNQWYDNKEGILLGNWNNFTPGTTTNASMKSTSGYGYDYYVRRTNVSLNHNGSYISNPSALLSALKVANSLQYNITENDGRYVPSSTFSGNNTSANGVNAGDDRGLKGEDVIFNHKTNMLFNFSQHIGLNATIGGQYWYNSFNDVLLKAVGDKTKKIQHIGALFIEGELMLFDMLFITGGVRGNYNSIFGENLSPRIYVAYNVLEALTIKGGISTGYRSPSLNSLVNGVVGSSNNGTQQIYGNPNLTPETSVNYELSLLSDNDIAFASLTGFYTDFTNRQTSINYSAGSAVANTGYTCPASATRGCGYYINVGKAISYGLEVALNIKPISVGYGEVSLNAAYTLNKTKVTDTAPTARGNIGLRLTNIPEHNANASLHYDSRYFGAYIRGEAKSGVYKNLTYPSGNTGLTNASIRDNGSGEWYKGLYLLHLGAYVKPKNNLKINFAIYNVLNKDFIDYFSYTNYSTSGGQQQTTTMWANNYNFIREGRRYYVNLSLDF